MLVALDTSTRFAGLALVDGGRVLAELNWEVGQRHSTELLTRLDWLLRSRGSSPADLTAVAVATGPGSFNGVRVAVTAAKALALAWHIPLFAHCTLDVIAWGASFADRDVWAILEAGRGQLYAARYAAPAASPAQWHPVDGYHVLTPAELAERMSQPALVCGEWQPQTRVDLEAHMGDRIQFTSEVFGRRAGWLAELALARLATGTFDDPARVEPQYMRKPAITKSKKAGLARANSGSALTVSQAGDSARSARHGEEASRAIYG
jgi:tRNA threonylcarbamoyladenosine biosynthesis protein TsaB